MTLLQPLWLLLLLPLALHLWQAVPTSNVRRSLRLALWLLLVAALCRPALWLPRSLGTVVVVVDRSASMPDDSTDWIDETLRRLESSRPEADRLAVVSFAEEVVIEQRPGEAQPLRDPPMVGSEQSLLADAIERGLALAPMGGGGRLLVLSDGQVTGEDLERVAGLANLQQVAVDYRSMERDMSQDLAIEDLDVPLEVSPGETFLLNSWVQSPWPQDVTYELRRGPQVLEAGRRSLSTGRNRWTFRDRVLTQGAHAYRLSVRGEQADVLPENNTADFLVTVRGPRPLLLVSDREPSGLADLLRRGGLDVRVSRSEELRGRVEDLAGFSALILDNVSASALGTSTMEQISSWVRHTGGGLLVTGGRQAYGLGGYFRSPLEDVLPVSMELRQEHRKLPLAIVVALDRSGSMGAEVRPGLDKMDLANRATVELLNLLTPLDEFGVIAVDSEPYIVQKLVPIQNTGSMRRQILSIDSMGGGIFVFEALQAAYKQLLDAEASTRHILLFADASDAERPGAYRELIAEGLKAGVTVSVVGLGTELDRDANLLREIASLGGGQVFFTERPEELPRLFIQDTFMTSRSAFLEETTAVDLTAGFELLTGQSLSQPPPIGGYNLTYLRPEAQIVGITRDDQEAPWIANWSFGLGRVVAVTAEVDGEFSGPFATWSEAGQLLTGLARWTAGSSDALGTALVIPQIERGHLRLQVHLESQHLDPQHLDQAGAAPRWYAVQSRGAGKPQESEGVFRWRDPRTLEAELPLVGDRVTLASVQLPGGGVVALPAARLPYSPEFQPSPMGSGRRRLADLADATGGRQSLEVADIWTSLPRLLRTVELTPWLLALAMLALLLEVLERRGAVLTLLVERGSKPFGRRRERDAEKDVAQDVGQQATAPRAAATEPSATTPTMSPAAEPPAPVPPKSKPQVTSKGDLGSAFDKARRRAHGRRRGSED